MIGSEERKKNFSENLGHNILELYNVVIQTRLATSKTRLDNQEKKLGTGDASRAAERLKNQDVRK